MLATPSINDIDVSGAVSLASVLSVSAIHEDTAIGVDGLADVESAADGVDGEELSSVEEVDAGVVAGPTAPSSDETAVVVSPVETALGAPLAGLTASAVERWFAKFGSVALDPTEVDSVAVGSELVTSIPALDV
jgi:hypothetical protein